MAVQQSAEYISEVTNSAPASLTLRTLDLKITGGQLQRKWVVNFGDHGHLKQTLEHTGSGAPLVFNDLVQLGSARRVLNDDAKKDKSTQPTFSIALTVASGLVDKPRAEIALEFAASSNLEHPTILASVRLADDDGELLLVQNTAPPLQEPSYELRLTDRGRKSFSEQFQKSPFKISDGAKVTVERFLPTTIETGVGESKFKLQLPIGFLGGEIGQTLDRFKASLTSHLRYVGPLRIEPTDMYSQTPRGIGVRGEYCMAYLRTHRKSIVRDGMPNGTSGELFQCVNSWLRQLGVSSGLKFRKVGDLYFETLTDRSRHLTEVGCGVSQILPVVVQVLSAGAGDVVLLEQPEIHLHQRLQAVLADLLLNAIHREVQIIVETHSEILIQRLRRRIAESEDDDYGKSIALYFGDGASFQEIPIERNGQVRVWPNEFFDQGLKELRAMSIAAQRRVDD